MANLPEMYLEDREGVSTPPSSPPSSPENDGSLSESQRARRNVYAEMVENWVTQPSCTPEWRAHINSFTNPEEAVNWITSRVLAQPPAPTSSAPPTSVPTLPAPSVAPGMPPTVGLSALASLPDLARLTISQPLPVQFAAANPGQGTAAPIPVRVPANSITAPTVALSEKELSEFRKTLSQPGQFDHTKTDMSAYDWLASWKTYMLTARWSEVLWVSTVTTHLRGLTADLWIQHANSLNALPSWTEFCTWLQTISGQRLTPEKARENLNRLKQTGRMSDFLAAFNAEFHRLTPELRPDTYTTIHIILHDAIAPVIRKRLFPKLGGGHYTNLPEFLNLLAIEGQEMETAQARAKANSHSSQSTGSAGPNLGVSRAPMKRTGQGHGKGQARSSGYKTGTPSMPSGSGRTTGSQYLKLGPQKDKMGNEYPHLTGPAFSHFMANNMCIACAEKGHRATDLDNNGRPVCKLRGKAKPQIRALQNWLTANGHLLKEN